MKKKTPEFNMSEVIRTELTANPKLSSPEMVAIIGEKHPKFKINKNSFSVAFYTTRKKLGIAKPSARSRRTTKKTRSVSGINMNVIKAAVVFLRQMGSVESAIEAVKTVQSLQLN